MDNKTFIIAEIGQAHDGSLGILHSYIEALKSIGIDAIKFQTHIAEAESSVHEPFRINFSYEDQNRYDYWKRMSFTKDQWKSIKKHCDEIGVEFMSTPFSNLAVDWLEEIGVKRYKVGSGDVSNFLLLEKIAKTNKEIIISSGMSSFNELDKSVEFIKKFHNKISILQCTTSYPTKPENIGLNVISDLKARYNLRIGFSDHSGSINTSLAAISLGAKIVEFHVVFDRQMFGPDSSSSLTIEEVKKCVEGIRYIEKILRNKLNKNQIDNYKKERKIFGKSLALNKDMKAGEIIEFDDLEGKKPADFGIPSNEFEKIIGKKLKYNKEKWDFVNYEDLYD